MHGRATAHGSAPQVVGEAPRLAGGADAGPRPRLHPDVEQVVIGDQTILTRDGRLHLALSHHERQLLLDLETGRRTPGPADLTAEGRDDATVDDLLRELRDAGFLRGSAPPSEPSCTFSTSGVECGGFDRVVAAVHRMGGRWCLHRPVVALLALLTAAGGVATSAALRTDGQTPPEGIATLVTLIVFGWITTAVHETAHALVIHHGGRRVGRAGLGFYWGSLGFYVDATDALFLPRRRRAAQAAAGPGADAVLAALLGLTAWGTAPSELSATLALVAVLAWLEVALNLVPFLKLDGYWVLADLLDQPDLAERSWQALLRIGHRPRQRRQGYLAAYAAASLAFGTVLLTGAAAAWLSSFGPLVTDAWGGGPVDRLVALAFVVPLAVGVVVAAAQVAVGFGQRGAAPGRGGGDDHRREVSSHASDPTHPPAEPPPALPQVAALDG